jgi:hypothetical protein
MRWSKAPSKRTLTGAVCLRYDSLKRAGADVIVTLGAESGCGVRSSGETARHVRLKRPPFMGGRKVFCARGSNSAKLSYVPLAAIVAAKTDWIDSDIRCKQALRLRQDVIAKLFSVSTDLHGAKFLKPARTLSKPGMAIRSSLSLIRRTSPRSGTLVTRGFCVTCVPCKIASTTAPSSTN